MRWKLLGYVQRVVIEKALEKIISIYEHRTPKS